MPNRPARGNDRGAVAVIVAVFAIVAMILLAFVVDRGRVYVERNQLQNAVDAAVLAAVQETCGNPIEDPNGVRQVAIDYAASNGVTVSAANVIVQDGVNDAVTGVSVAAERTVNSVFGGFAGVGSSLVAARATATRLCRLNFQFVADQDFWFTSNVNLQAPLYAGQCFNGGSQSTYNSVIAVATAQGSDSCAPFFPSLDDDPINLGTSPTIQSGYRPEYDVSGVTASGAYAQSTFFATYGANPQATFPSTGACSGYDGNVTTLLSCTGDGPNFQNGDLIEASVLTDGRLNLQGASFGTGPIMIYTSDNSSGAQDAIELPASVPANVFIYAPNGEVRFNGAGTALQGTVFAKNIRTSGGGASATAGQTIRFAGDWRLSQ